MSTQAHAVFRRVLEKLMKLDRNVVIALAMAAAASLVLQGYRMSNPGQGAEHYYMREHRGAYRVMQVCYVVIVASIGFNLRFVALELLDVAKSVFSSKPVTTSATENGTPQRRPL